MGHVVVKVGYGCCVGSWQKFNTYTVPSANGRPLLGLAGQTSIGVAYNSIFDAYKTQDVDWLVMLHDDLELLSPAHAEGWLEDVTAADPDIGIVGVIGSMAQNTLGWWHGEMTGHQMTDSGMVKSPDSSRPMSGYVNVIEGSYMAYSRKAIETLRFDLRYPGFHAYAEDICQEAVTAGIKVYVANIETIHHSTLGFKSPEIEASWQECDRIFRKKWNV